MTFDLKEYNMRNSYLLFLRRIIFLEGARFYFLILSGQGYAEC